MIDESALSFSRRDEGSPEQAVIRNLESGILGPTSKGRSMNWRRKAPMVFFHIVVVFFKAAQKHYINIAPSRLGIDNISRQHLCKLIKSGNERMKNGELTRDLSFYHRDTSIVLKP